jgi:hypothetical protein
MICTYTYNGRNGGRRGQQCGRPEQDHCKGVADCPDAMHDFACKLFIKDEHTRVREAMPKSRSMVHHPFHRRSIA